MPAADFERVFHELRDILRPFEPRLLLKVDTPAEYSVDTPFAENWKRELFFGAVQIKKSYVSFHLMPVYMFPDLLLDMSEGLKKRMQGKSCFNFKRLEPELIRELAELTRRGFARFEAERLV
jgi:DNA-binding transcriptional ArsR family regulator